METAVALNRIADALFAISGSITGFGILFLFFKNMGGKDKITIKHEHEDVK